MWLFLLSLSQLWTEYYIALPNKLWGLQRGKKKSTEYWMGRRKRKGKDWRQGRIALPRSKEEKGAFSKCTFSSSPLYDNVSSFTGYLTMFTVAVGIAGGGDEAYLPWDRSCLSLWGVPPTLMSCRESLFTPAHLSLQWINFCVPHAIFL